VFLGEVKARPKDIISFSLDYNKQKLSTDKQSIIKPHFTRHAGKAGGLPLVFAHVFFVVPKFEITSFRFISNAEMDEPLLCPMHSESFQSISEI